MSDDTLPEHIGFAANKLQKISAAFFEMEDEHKELLSQMNNMPPKPPANSTKKDTLGLSVFDRARDNEPDSEEEFEEDMEEDVIDRYALKKQSTSIVDKGAKKKKPRRRRAKADD